MLAMPWGRHEVSCVTGAEGGAEAQAVRQAQHVQERPRSEPEKKLRSEGTTWSEALSRDAPVRNVAFALSEVGKHCGIWSSRIAGQRITGMF